MIYLIIFLTNILYSAETNLFKEINMNVALLNKSKIETTFESYIPEMQPCSISMITAVENFYQRNNIRNSKACHNLFETALTMLYAKENKYLLCYVTAEHQDFLHEVDYYGKKEWDFLLTSEKDQYNNQTSPVLDSIVEKYVPYLQMKLNEKNTGSSTHLGHVHKLATCAYLVHLAKPENC